MLRHYYTLLAALLLAVLPIVLGSRERGVRRRSGRRNNNNQYGHGLDNHSPNGMKLRVASATHEDNHVGSGGATFVKAHPRQNGDSRGKDKLERHHHPDTRHTTTGIQYQRRHLQGQVRDHKDQDYEYYSYDETVGEPVLNAEAEPTKEGKKKDKGKGQVGVDGGTLVEGAVGDEPDEEEELEDEEEQEEEEEEQDMIEIFVNDTDAAAGLLEELSSMMNGTTTDDEGFDFEETEVDDFPLIDEDGDEQAVQGVEAPAISPTGKSRSKSYSYDEYASEEEAVAAKEKDNKKDKSKDNEATIESAVEEPEPEEEPEPDEPEPIMEEEVEEVEVEEPKVDKKQDDGDKNPAEDLILEEEEEEDSMDSTDGVNITDVSAATFVPTEAEDVEVEEGYSDGEIEVEVLEGETDIETEVDNDADSDGEVEVLEGGDPTITVAPTEDSEESIAVLGEEKDTPTMSPTESDDYFANPTSMQKVILVEPEDCIELRSAYFYMSRYELNEAACMENPKSCTGGCCRLDDHVRCDQENAEPELKCICNQNTAANNKR